MADTEISPTLLNALPVRSGFSCWSGLADQEVAACEAHSKRRACLLIGRGCLPSGVNGMRVASEVKEKYVADEYNLALIISAAFSAGAAVLHVGVVIAGPAGYRLAGAGKRFIRAAEAGRAFPAMITIAIALVLMVWAAYALSGAAVISPLPLLRPVLSVITLIYLLRGFAGPWLLKNTGRSNRFIVVSSAICIVFGLTHLVGLVQTWERLQCT